MRSLQTQLSTGLMIVLIPLIGILLAISTYSLRHLAEEFVATRLEHDMDSLLVALEFNDAGRPILKPGQLNPIFHKPYSGHYYKIVVGLHQRRSRSLWDADLAIPASIADEATRHMIRGPQDQKLLVLARTFQMQDRHVVIAVGEDFTPLEKGLQRIMIGCLVVAALLLGGLMLLQRMIVQRSLKPLDDTRRDILRLAQGEIRQLNTDIPTEIQPLVGEINRLVDVMTQRLQRSRRGLGNLAHALKTPLTILLQLAEHPKVKHQDALCGELGRQTRRIRLLIDRELKRARIAGAAAPGQRVILENEIKDLVDTLKKIYRNKELSIQCQIPAGSFFTGDRDDLLELLGNLLDNACQWATHRILLTVKHNIEGLCLRVEDDGPGCPPEQLDLLTQRGVRIDESHGGHGLGLAIVADILEHYEGRLHLGRSSELGGFLAQVEIPNLTVGYSAADYRVNHRN